MSDNQGEKTTFRISVRVNANGDRTALTDKDIEDRGYDLDEQIGSLEAPYRDFAIEVSVDLPANLPDELPVAAAVDVPPLPAVETSTVAAEAVP